MTSNLRFKIKIYTDLLKYIVDEEKRNEIILLIEDMLCELNNSNLFDEYENSEIRNAVMLLADNNSGEKFTAKDIIKIAEKNNIGIFNSPQQIGNFLHLYQRRFYDEGIIVRIIKNGTAPKRYRFEKSIK